MQPDVFDELDWNEGMDLAERVEKRYAEDLEAVVEVAQTLFQNNAVMVANAVVQAVGSLGAR